MEFHDDQDIKGQRYNPLPVDDEKIDSEPTVETVDNHYLIRMTLLWAWRRGWYWTPPRAAVPALSSSALSQGRRSFNGIDLINAFGIVGLEYGNLKIYERLDANRLVDFGVACMVEPGTFPDSDLDTFYCPGLVFFMQPGALDDAQAVFDDYLDTIQLLAVELDGTIRDHHRQPLTDATIQSLRQSLWI